MTIEIPEDVFEEIADRLGIWGAHDEERCGDNKPCRCCWMLHYAGRLREAIATEAYLQQRYQRLEQ